MSELLTYRKDNVAHYQYNHIQLFFMLRIIYSAPMELHFHCLISFYKYYAPMELTTNDEGGQSMNFKKIASLEAKYL